MIIILIIIYIFPYLLSIDKKIPEEIENINDNPTCNNNNDDFGLYKKYL